MSISDLIVVMKEGVVNQIGMPQEVYDNPVNLFVAKFLGTPPINVFRGRVSGGKLFIGDSEVMSAEGAPDGEVYVGVRPEGFVLSENGALRCKLSEVEVMGRDITVVASHSELDGVEIRAIINSESRGEVHGDEVRFDLKPNKVYIFDKTTEKRICVK